MKPSGPSGWLDFKEGYPVKLFLTFDDNLYHGIVVDSQNPKVELSDYPLGKFIADESNISEVFSAFCDGCDSIARSNGCGDCEREK